LGGWGYGSGGGADEHVFVGVVGDWIDEGLNSIQRFISLERALAEIIQPVDREERRLFKVGRLLSRRNNNLLIILPWSAKLDFTWTSSRCLSVPNGRAYFLPNALRIFPPEGAP
jgi:hypothetical protein